MGKSIIGVVLGCCLFMIGLVSGSCSMSTNSPYNRPVEVGQGVEKQKPGKLKGPFDPRDPLIPYSLKEAWQLFTEGGRYRMASAEDFRFSKAARKKIKSIMGSYQRYVEDPSVFERFHPGGYNYDLAVIVIDTTRNEQARFGLVIFNAPEDETGEYKPYWVYTDRDLSTTLLTWASTALFITDHHDNGSQQTCIVEWDRQVQKYTCNSK